MAASQRQSPIWNKVLELFRSGSTRAVHNDFVHPLQSLFLYFLLNSLDISYIIFEYMRATHKAISSSSPPGPKMLSLPYGMLLSVIFAHFDSWSTAYRPQSRVPSAPLLSSSCNFTSILTPSFTLNLNLSLIRPRLLHHQPLTQSLLPPIPPRLSVPIPFLRPLLSSRMMISSISTLFHLKVRQFHSVSTNPLFLTNHNSSCF